YVVEIGKLENCKFESTDITLLYLLLDKQKQKDKPANTFIYDFKQKKYLNQEKIKLDAEGWQIPMPEQEQEQINIIELNKEIAELQAKRIKKENEMNIFLRETFPDDFKEPQIIYKGVKV
ncbi:MAG: hypothetical protein LBF23_01800, partial [Endomicrobium sp.]|nr:hypothetical protein [Endomicrobium sp.]